MLQATPLCTVDIRLEDGVPVNLGASPWRSRRISYIAGGVVAGERLRGDVLPGGGDWSDVGWSASGDSMTLIDVRSVWRTHDAALIYVAYTGRLVIPADVLAHFRDRDRIERLPADRYYFRIQPTFETGDERYAWLNAVAAVGLGKCTARGVSYQVFALD
jgi:hypothetical protein